MAKQSNRRFMGWCFEHAWYNLRNIINKSPEQICDTIKEDFYARELSDKRLETVWKELRLGLERTNLEENVITKADYITNKVFKELESGKIQNNYQELVELYRIEDDSTDYEIIVLMTELCREGIVTSDELFAAFDSILRVVTGRPAALNKKRKFEYGNLHKIFSGAEVENKEALQIAPCFADIKLSKIKLSRINGLTAKEVKVYYNKRLLEKVQNLYPIISNTDDNWEGRFHELIKKDVNYEVMYMRHIEKKSLQKIGDIYNVTREAVRLKEGRFVESYDDIVEKYIDMRAEESQGYFKPFESEELSELYSHRFANYRPDKYKFDNKYLFTNDYFLDVYNKVVEAIGNDGYMTKDEIEKEISKYCDDSEACKALAQSFANEGLLYAYTNCYVITEKKGKRPASRNIAKYIIHKHFKNGVHPLQDDDINRYNEISQRDFGLKPIKGHALEGRLTLCKEVILSDNAGFNHIDSFDISPELLAEIKEYIDGRIDEFPITSFELFTKYKDDLTSGGISNYVLLYGILRYYYPYDYLFKKLTIYPRSNEKSKSRRAYEYLKERQKGATKEKLQEVVGGMNAGQYTNLIREFPVMYCKETNLYYAFDANQFPDKLVKKAGKQLKADFDKYGFCPIERLFLILEKEWRKCGITHPVDLAYASRNLFKDFAKVSNSIISPKNGAVRFTRGNILYYFIKAENLSGHDYDEIRDNLISFLGMTRNEMSNKFSWYLKGDGITITKDHKITI